MNPNEVFVVKIQIFLIKQHTLNINIDNSENSCLFLLCCHVHESFLTFGILGSSCWVYVEGTSVMRTCLFLLLGYFCSSCWVYVEGTSVMRICLFLLLGYFGSNCRVYVEGTSAMCTCLFLLFGILRLQLSGICGRHVCHAYVSFVTFGIFRL